MFEKNSLIDLKIVKGGSQETSNITGDSTCTFRTVADCGDAGTLLARDSVDTSIEFDSVQVK